MASQKKILVIRNDKLGDFILAWPAFSLLKKQYPDARIIALVPAYTAPMAQLCESIDEVLIDDRKPSFFRDVTALAENIRHLQIDTAISLFSESRTALALLFAGVSIRIGPATKIAQIFLNRRLKQKRSRSLKPEYEYNLDLVRHYISNNGDAPVATKKPPFLKFDKAEIAGIKDVFIKTHQVPVSSRLVFVHPGTGGSAVNLSLEQYADLIASLTKSTDSYFVITAGPGETEQANRLSALLETTAHCTYHSSDGIVGFSKFLSICDIFISGSTGPLHIAAALNVCTAAFYPARRSATSLRWQTINDETRRLAISPDEYTGESDMLKIDTDSAARLIIEKFYS